MKTYEMKYHVLGKGCCGRRTAKPSQAIRIQARDPDDARKRLRKICPGARFETVEEVTE